MSSKRARTLSNVVAIIAAAALVPAHSLAQAVGGTQGTEVLRIIVTAADRTQSAGALAALIDRKGMVVSEGLIHSSGQRSMTAPPGSYRVRLLRIGYAPTWSDWITLPRSTPLAIELNQARINLNTLVVRSKTACSRVDQDAEGTGLVWAEVTKALRASQLAIQDADSLARASLYRRVSGADGSVRSADTTWVPIRKSQPFSAVDPALLATRGYVRGDQEKGWEFFGPDEKVLLSNEFAATHCFHLVRDPAKAGLVGVAFEPVPRRRTADIAGTIWVEERTSELKEIRFRYVRAGAPSDFNAGGFTTFRRLTSGAWMVSEWQLRMPLLEVRREAPRYGYPQRENVTAVGYSEFGGGVETIGSAPHHFASGSGRIRGVVYDSIADRPLENATIQLGNLKQITDGAGEFVFDSLGYGPARITILHPSLHALGYVALEQDIEVTSDSVYVSLSTPSFERTWQRLCGTTAREEGTWQGIVHGFVRDGSGRPASDARIRLDWQVIPTPTGPAAGARTELRSMKLEVTSGSDGHYSACGFVPGATGTISGSGGNVNSPMARFAMTGSRVVRVDVRAR